MKSEYKFKYFTIENFNRRLRFYQVNHEWIAKWQPKTNENIDWRGIKIKNHRVGVEEYLKCPVTDKILKSPTAFLFLQ